MRFKAKVIDSNGKTIEVEVWGHTKKLAIATLKQNNYLILEMDELDSANEKVSRKYGKQSSKIRSSYDNKIVIINNKLEVNKTLDNELTVNEILDKLQVARSKGNINASVWAKEIAPQIFLLVLLNWVLFDEALIIQTIICFTLIWLFLLFLDDKRLSLESELERMLSRAEAKERERERIAYEKKLTQQFNLARNIVSEHLKELSVRRNQLTINLNYGLIDNSKWEKEMEHFILNVIFPITGNIYEKDDDQLHYQMQKIIDEEIDNYQLTSPSLPFSTEMSPVEYENYVVNILNNSGWEAKITPATGDQGVDVIAEINGIKVVIQCKLYSTSVGNKAVQEIIAGKVFEKADYAAVVSNANYTRSAQQLASSSDVFLMHHDELKDLEDKCFC